LKWPSVDELSTLVPLPDGYRIDRFDRASIAPLIAAIREWHPHISVGTASCYLREDFYRNRVCLHGEAERNIFVVLIRFKDELVGMWSYEREIDSLAIYGRLIVVAPEHRGTRLSVHISVGSENVGRSMGAEFLYAMATLRNPYAQRALESAGYRLLGFFPGYDREEVSPGVVKRVYQAVYAKLLVPDENVLRPDPKNMTPKTNKIFELLFSN
jgi:RimJ/RimL family protein N-acetyltransferase